MYESRNEPLLSLKVFKQRMAAHGFYALLIILATLVIGIFGHWIFNDVSLHDAFMNAIFVLGGVGTYSMPTSAIGKIFYAAYGFFVSLVVMATLGVILAPIAHRIMHKFHLDENDSEDGN